MFPLKRAAALFVLTSCLLPVFSYADHDEVRNVQVGPRPYYLIDKMSPSPLKRKLEQCSEGPFRKTNFSIGHRGGGTLQFPEHTQESHEAGARMGAGIQECDVTFTKDRQLVCRHDQCDLHTTTIGLQLFDWQRHEILIAVATSPRRLTISNAIHNEPGAN